MGFSYLFMDILLLFLWRLAIYLSAHLSAGRFWLWKESHLPPGRIKRGEKPDQSSKSVLCSLHTYKLPSSRIGPSRWIINDLVLFVPSSRLLHTGEKTLHAHQRHLFAGIPSPSANMKTKPEEWQKKHPQTGREALRLEDGGGKDGRKLCLWDKRRTRWVKDATRDSPGRPRGSCDRLMGTN